MTREITRLDRAQKGYFGDKQFVKLRSEIKVHREEWKDKNRMKEKKKKKLNKAP